MSMGTFLIRISICFILSIIIGIERQYRHRMVGLRTNVLVSLGAFMFMIVSFGVSTSDKTRIAAQIVSGIGFLGAGVILRDGNRIKGLNTAATLWCVAAIGVLTASGMVFEAAVGTFLVLISNIFLRFISHKIMEKIKLNKKEKCIIDITCKKNVEVLVRTTISKIVASNSLNLSKLEKEEVNEEVVKIRAVIVTSRSLIVEEMVNTIGVNPDIISILWEHQHLNFTQSDNEDDGTEEEMDEEN